jgi:hypothetical protein
MWKLQEQTAPCPAEFMLSRQKMDRKRPPSISGIPQQLHYI